MNPYQLIIGGVTLDPTVPLEAVRRTGGGRQVKERVSITGKIIRSQGNKTARRVQVTSPSPSWALLASQVSALRALADSGAPFSVTFGSAFETSGTFTNCWFDGDAVFEPTPALDYVNYSFTIYLPQEA
ncbi:hypothetical protein [Deinococcus ruber]|uniref:Uncharacterized protein n=1 Tax=Deinococcus ruber TaxID=1848197 RepID=A0A918C7Y4_9DEIO|nr:hypothetical protein [Deinococcus ruber]GGR11374.1 hypothetical protein GCM10008957_25150 [Deinococcus ruber]